MHYNVGKNLADKGNSTAAIRYYREAVRYVFSQTPASQSCVRNKQDANFPVTVRLHPTYVHAMNNLGNILKERNELIEAEQLLSKAVSIQYVVLHKHIIIRISLVPTLRNVITDRRPDFAAAWMNLGIVQNSLQKFDEAEQSYWNAIRFRKKYPDCYYNLGRLVSVCLTLKLNS